MLTRQSVYAALHVKADEEKPVLLMLCYSFFSGVSIYVFYIVANALFLVNYAKSMLPVAYIGGGLLLFLIGKINVGLQRHFDFSRLCIALIVFQFISVGLMLFAYEITEWKGVALTMFIWNRISVYVNNVTFWNSSAKIFNLEQAKRIFSLIATGDVVASIVSYLVVNVLLGFKAMETEELLYLSMAALLVSLGFMVAIIRNYRTQLAVRQQKETGPAEEDDQGEGRYFKNNYHMLVLLLGMLPVLGVYFGEFIFSVEVKRQFPIKEQLTLFLGQFFLVSSIIELLVKVFFYRFAIRTFGLVSGIIILPVALILVLGLAILFISLKYSVFFYILLSRFLCISVKKSFSDTSFQILYQPLERGESQELQNRVEIYAKPAGYILAGVILLALMGAGLGDPLEIMIVFVAILIGWTYASFRMQGEYQTTLGNLFTNLGNVFTDILPGKTTAERAEAEGQPLKPLSFDEIVSKAGSALPGERLEAIEMLGQSKRFLAFRYLIPFLQGKDVSQKNAALHASGMNGNPELWPYLFENLNQPDFRQAAAEAIRNVGERVLPALNEYFDKSEGREDVQIAIVGLVMEMEGDEPVRMLRQKLNHPDLAVRHQVFRALAARGYGARLNERPAIVQEAVLQIRFMTWLLAAQRDLSRSHKLYNSQLADELVDEYRAAMAGLINMLTILTQDKRLYYIQGTMQSKSENSRSYLLEILNMAIPAEHKKQVIPLFEDISGSDKLERLHHAFPQERLSVEDRLHDVINKDFARLGWKTKMLAIRALEDYPSEATTFILLANATSPVASLAEAALRTLYHLDRDSFSALYHTMQWSEDDFHCGVCEQVESSEKAIERLKTADA